MVRPHSGVAATFSLVRNKAQHLSFGEFGSKFAKATDNAPFLAASSIIVGEPGTVPEPVAEADVDVYAWPHNETSTGAAPIKRVAGANEDALVVIDATSAAGGLDVDLKLKPTFTTSLHRRTSLRRRTMACLHPCGHRPHRGNRSHRSLDPRLLGSEDRVG